MSNIVIGNTFWKRFWGLMLKNDIKNNEAMVLLYTRQVHTSFMKFNIRVIYVDKSFKVLENEVLRPWKIGRKVKGAEHIIEASENVKVEDEFIENLLHELEEEKYGRFF